MLVLALALVFKRASHSPCLVAAAITLPDKEILLLVGPIDRRPVWMVYGLDGRPHRAWGARPLPGGIIEDKGGRLRDPTAKPEPIDELEAGMSRLAPGQVRYFSDLVGSRLVHFREPSGILLERWAGGANSEHLLQRVNLDGSLVWSESLATLLGRKSFVPNATELRHAHVDVDARTLILVVQEFSTQSGPPVGAALSRLVIVDPASGRARRRADILEPEP